MLDEKSLSDFHQNWVKLVNKAFADYNSLTRNERIWFSVESLIGQVDNGGLISHYYNSGADRNIETIEDLEHLGHHDIAELLVKMNQLFPGGQASKDINERNAVISNWPDGHHDSLLDELDHKFYEGERSLELKLIEHITETGLSK
jgi:Domain of unknown function (DUF4375)